MSNPWQENGYQQNSNGFTTQWGRATLVGGGGSTTITFPMVFPNDCLNVVATPVASPNTGLIYSVRVESISTDSVLISGNMFDGTAITAPKMDVFWQALGY